MTANSQAATRLIIELLDRQRHDRAAFSCGVDRVDNFLKNTASRHNQDDHGKVYVAVEPPSNAVLGFFAISPHAVDIQSLSEEDRKRMPRFPIISAIYLSMVGVAKQCQGCGIGTFLMSRAMKKCVEGANIMGGHFIVLDAINEDAARMYRRLGFVDLPSTPGRMLIAMSTVRKAMAVADRSAT